MRGKRPVLSAQVAVFVPLRRLFSYSFNDEVKAKLIPGVRVVVPFGHREQVGVFTGFAESDVETKPIKAVLDEKPVFPEHLVDLVRWCASYYLCSAGEMFRAIGPRESLKKSVAYESAGNAPGRITSAKKKLLETLDGKLSAAVYAKKAGLTIGELEKETRSLIKAGLIHKREEYYFTESKLERVAEPPLAGTEPPRVHTDEQKKVIEHISRDIKERKGRVTLLQGVTGSGKTEVYLALCKKALETGGGAVVLVPEIALTFQFVRRFNSRFAGKVALLHSGLTPAQRREEWMRVADGSVSIVIGARSAVFAPMRDVRLVVVDEEHDGSYKQGEYPYYHARDVAAMLGKLTGAAVVLGSATPSLETYFNAESGKYAHCRLSERIDKRPMPKVELVDETENLFPPAVVEHLLKRVEKREQSLVFINRRGSAFSVKCRVCKKVLDCPNCSISLTYHKSGEKLMCHYCAYEVAIARKCPACGAESLFSFRGTGTQKVEQSLAEILPKARIARLDQDTAPTREKTFAVLKQFEEGDADILVGTQMTAKGHDFENLTYSIILGADDYLAFPDFRSAERTFSLVTQAAGRTGRGSKGGEVAICGSAHHYAIACAVTHDYDAFYREEILQRKKTGFPPFSRLIGMVFDAVSQSTLEKEMFRLSAEMPALPVGVQALGPAPALVYKVRNRFRWKMLLKGNNSRLLHEAAEKVEAAVARNVSVSIDVDPIGFY